MGKPGMKLHWSPRSPFVRKVMITLHETGQIADVACVRNPVAIDQPNPKVMADNPLGKIPTLVLTDGEAIYDSRVICEVLDGLHDGPRLVPIEPARRRQALVWQALGDGLLDMLVIWRAWAKAREIEPLAETDAYMCAWALKTRAGLDRLETMAWSAP